MNTAMETSVLKERLHSYIERADNELLLAIYVLLDKNINERNTTYDAATLEMLNNRVEEESTTYSVAENFDYIRANKPE